jgi:hypothetical protein
MAGSRAAGEAATDIARPAIRKLLKGRKSNLEFKGVTHPDRAAPRAKRSNNYTKDLPKPYKKDGKWVIHVKQHDKWNTKDYRTKVDEMTKAGKDGELHYVKDTNSKRTGAQDELRGMEEEKAVREALDIEEAGDLDGAQKHLDSRLKELDQQEADHIRELQVGGEDKLDNLKMIDGVTNHGMGGQIRSQIRHAVNAGMQEGELVQIVELPGLMSNR